MLPQYTKKNSIEKFICTFCELECENAEEMSVHMQSIHKSGNENVDGNSYKKKAELLNFNCVPCKLNFEDTKALTSHILLTHSDMKEKKNIEQDLVPKVFYETSSLPNDPLLKKLEVGLYHCNYCTKLFLGEADSVEHLKTVHANVLPDQRTNVKLCNHVKDEIKVTVFRCVYCRTVFQNEINCRNHIINEHIDKTKHLPHNQPLKYPTTTNLSDDVFMQFLKLTDANNTGDHKVHTNTQEGTKRKEYKCIACSASYDNKVDCEKHIQMNHSHLKK